jgi:hypothetical protein
MRFRHYGRVVLAMIEKVSAVEDSAERVKMGEALANVMKRAYLNWNRDSVEDRVIKKDLRDLSNGKIEVPVEVELAASKDLIDPTLRASSKQSNRKRKGGRSNRKRNNNRKNHRK